MDDKLGARRAAHRRQHVRHGAGRAQAPHAPPANILILAKRCSQSDLREATYNAAWRLLYKGARRATLRRGCMHRRAQHVPGHACCKEAMKARQGRWLAVQLHKLCFIDWRGSSRKGRGGVQVHMCKQRAVRSKRCIRPRGWRLCWPGDRVRRKLSTSSQQLAVHGAGHHLSVSLQSMSLRYLSIPSL